MAVGAEDYIDQLLVKKYADEKVDNHDDMESMPMDVNPSFRQSSCRYGLYDIARSPRVVTDDGRVYETSVFPQA